MIRRSRRRWRLPPGSRILRGWGGGRDGDVGSFAWPIRPGIPHAQPRTSAVLHRATANHGPRPTRLAADLRGSGTVDRDPPTARGEIAARFADSSGRAGWPRRRRGLTRLADPALCPATHDRVRPGYCANRPPPPPSEKAGRSIVIRRPRGSWRGLPPGSRILRGWGRVAAMATWAHSSGRSGPVSSSSTNRPPRPAEDQPSRRRPARKRIVDRDPQSAGGEGHGEVCRRVRGFFGDGVDRWPRWRCGLTRLADPAGYPAMHNRLRPRYCREALLDQNPDDISLHVNACALMGRKISPLLWRSWRFPARPQPRPPPLTTAYVRGTAPSDRRDRPKITPSRRRPARKRDGRS